MLETQLKQSRIQLVLDIYCLFNKGMDSLVYISVSLRPQLQYPMFQVKSNHYSSWACLKCLLQLLFFFFFLAW